MSVVINLFGGSGVGKSTTGALLFGEMKLRGYHCELVREYVKAWAWEGIKIGPYDQLYLLGKQSKAESRLYDKVDYIITDSPLLLSPIYERFYSGGSITELAALDFMRLAKLNGVSYRNFVLERTKPFDARGRYEDADTAARVDLAVRDFLSSWGIEYKRVTADDRDRVGVILQELGL